MVYAVAHQQFAQVPPAELAARVKPGGVLIDVKSQVDPEKLPPGRVHYWSL